MSLGKADLYLYPCHSVEWAGKTSASSRPSKGFLVRLNVGELSRDLSSTHRDFLLLSSANLLGNAAP
jgi:hypothetical protein